MFDGSVTDPQIHDMLAVIAITPRHRYILRTHYVARAREMLARSQRVAVAGQAVTVDCVSQIADRARQFSSSASVGGIPAEELQFRDSHFRRAWPLPNLALSAIVSSQKDADHKVPDLLDAPLAHRWVCVSPAREQISIDRIFRLRRRTLLRRIEVRSLDHQDTGRLISLPNDPKVVTALQGQCADNNWEFAIEGQVIFVPTGAQPIIGDGSLDSFKNAAPPKRLGSALIEPGEILSDNSAPSAPRVR